MKNSTRLSYVRHVEGNANYFNMYEGYFFSGLCQSSQREGIKKTKKMYKEEKIKEKITFDKY